MLFQWIRLNIIFLLVLKVYCQNDNYEYTFFAENCTVQFNNDMHKCLPEENCTNVLNDIENNNQNSSCEIDKLKTEICCERKIEYVPLKLNDSCNHSEFPGICQLYDDCHTLDEGKKTGGYFVCDISTICCPFQDPKLSAEKNLRICQTKCIEYAKSVFDENDIDQCNKYNYDVRGNYAGPYEFSHMAQIGYEHDNNTLWRCGGALISDRFILTSAQCLYSEKLGPAKYVRLGSYYTGNNESYRTQDFDIVKSIRHPKYNPPAKYNDIALLELDKAARFTRYVRPACLYVRDNNADAIAAGWGSIDFQTPTSDALTKVYLRSFEDEICNNIYANITEHLPLGIDQETQLCMREFNDDGDICKSGTGSPIQHQTQRVYCMHDVIGITSYGQTCEPANLPGLYTRVYPYLQWIESTVWG